MSILNLTITDSQIPIKTECQFYDFDENQTKKIKMDLIIKSSYLYNEYNHDDTYFTEKEKIELILANVDVIIFIKDPTDAMMDLAVTLIPSKLLVVKQTLIRIVLALDLFIQKIKGHFCYSIKNYNWVDQIDYSDYYNNFDNPEYKRIFRLIIDRLAILGKSPKLNCKYLSDEELTKLVIRNTYGLKEIANKCPERLNQSLCLIAFSASESDIQYIPHQFQDEAMINKILSGNTFVIRNYAKYLKPDYRIIEKMREICSVSELPHDYQTKEICLRDLKGYPSYIKYIRDDLIDEEILDIVYNSNCKLSDIPEKYRDRRLCKKLIVNYVYDLKYVPDDLIDKELLAIVFKVNTGCQKRDRMNFVAKYDTDKIVAIIKHNSFIFEKLETYQQNDRVIKAMLENNGYALVYLTKEQQEVNDGEYVKLALSVEPKASKYIKT